MHKQLVQTLVVEEIRRIVADAIGDGRIIRAGRHASELLRMYANCGLTAEQVVTEIGAAAARAGVPGSCLNMHQRLALRWFAEVTSGKLDAVAPGLCRRI